MNELNYRLGCVLDVTTSTSNWLWPRCSHSLLQYLLLKDQLRAFSVFISWRQSTNFQTKDSVTVRVDAIVLFQVDWRNHWIHENLRSQTCWLHSYTIEIFKTFKSEKKWHEGVQPVGRGVQQQELQALHPHPRPHHAQVTISWDIIHIIRLPEEYCHIMMSSHNRTVLGTNSLAEMLSERWFIWSKAKGFELKSREQIARQLTADLERATDKWGIHVLRCGRITQIHKYTKLANEESMCSGAMKKLHNLSFKLSFPLQGGDQGCVPGSRNATSDGRWGWGYKRC